MKNAGAIGAITVLSAAAIVAGCSMGGGTRPMPGLAALPANSGIDGNWIDEARTGITIFTNGQFQTIATDTGNQLSRGTYRYRDQVLIELTGESIMRQVPIAFNCSVASVTQLNCTASSNKTFVLTRYNGMVPEPVISQAPPAPRPVT